MAPGVGTGFERVYLPPEPSWMSMLELWSRAKSAFRPRTPP